MVRLKSRQQCPVNGFQFVQPETGHEFKTWDFEGLVREITAHREANPRFKLSTDVNTIRNEVDHANAMRMLSIRNADSYVTSDLTGGPDPNRLPPRGLRRLAGLAGGGANQMFSGAQVLRDWLGAGAVPVPGEQSEARAQTCAIRANGKPCPKNAPGDWTSWFTEPVANIIREQLALKKDLDLTTKHDEALNVCDACGCPLKLKVHVPLEHIDEYLSAEVQAKLDPLCWILAEKNNTKPDHEMPNQPPQAAG